MKLMLCALWLLPAWGLAQQGLRLGETVRETVRETDAVFPGAEPLDKDGEQTVWAVRIVSAATGLPIPGATVSVPDHPHRGAAPVDRIYLAKAKADRDGWVRIATKDLKGWRDYIIADAHGYVANEHCYAYESECELLPGTDVPIRLLNYRGRPVAGAVVGLNLGCGHIPHQRLTTTDSLGVGLFRSVDPERHEDIFTIAPGLHNGSWYLTRTWRPGGAPVDIHASPGISISGQILNRDGSPRGGIRVGVRGSQSIWIDTDEKGRFALMGFEAWSWIDVYKDPDDEKPIASFVSPPQGIHRRFTLGAKEPLLDVAMQLSVPKGEMADPMVITAVRSADGYSMRTYTDYEGQAKLELPVGKFSMTAGQGLGAWQPAKLELVVKKGAVNTAAFTLKANRTILVDARQVIGKRTAITTVEHFLLIDLDSLEDGRLFVPTHVPATIRVAEDGDAGYMVKFFDTPAAGKEGDKPLVLDWFPTTQVKVKLLDAKGQATKGWLRIVEADLREWDADSEDDEASLRPEIDSTLTGRLFWQVLLEDKELARQSGAIAIAKAGGKIDLGVVKLIPKEPVSMRVELPPGVESADLQIRVSRRESNYQLWFSHDAEKGYGPFETPSVRRGDAIRIRFDVSAPEFLIEAQGVFPLRVTLPGGTLILKPVDAKGKPIPNVAVLIDGEQIDAKEFADGRVMATGIRAGKRVITVAARGYRARIYTLTFAQHEKRRLDTVFRPHK